jgi:diguanylate cyclase (GGDEF)-like protein
MKRPSHGEPGGALRVTLRELRALFRRPSASLPSRITLLVFAATMLTSLLVTGISVHSIQGFLARGIEQKFPSLLVRAQERLDLWYAQRRLDIDTFARSATVVANVARLRANPRDPRARQELGEYLSYVLERFDAYEALLVLDPAGRVLLSAGDDVELPERARARLVGRGESSVSDLFVFGARRFQVASAPVRGARDHAIGSLHAVLAGETIEAMLVTDDLGAGGRVSLVGRGGDYLLSTERGVNGNVYGRPLPDAETEPVVSDYRDDKGERMIGAALPLGHFGWTLVVEEPYAAAFRPAFALIRRTLGINLAVVLGFGLIALRIAISVVGPIRALSEGARRVAEGETDVVVLEASAADEIGLLTRTWNKMTARLHKNRVELEQKHVELEAAQARLRAQNQELRSVNETLQQLSSTDELTMLPNHRCFQEQLSREVKRARRTAAPLALVLIDIDNFKQLNDRHGHLAGDAVLRHVAGVMSGVLRETDHLARYGGEEFALLAPQTDLEGALELAEKIRVAVSQAETPIVGDEGPQTLRVTVSIGVSLFKDNRQELFGDADRALYRAKAGGKDCVES